MSCVNEERLNQLMVENALLDCKMGSLKAAIQCKTGELQKYAKELKDTECQIDFLKNELYSVKIREQKCKDHNESLRREKKALEELEKSLVKQLKAVKDRSGEERKEQNDLLLHYLNIWEEYQKKYHILPWVKKLSETAAESKKLNIELSLSKQLLIDEENKCSILSAIKRKREIKVVVHFAEVWLKTSASRTQFQKLMDKNSQLLNKIKQLEAEKNEMLQKVSLQTQGALEKVKERKEVTQAGYQSLVKLGFKTMPSTFKRPSFTNMFSMNPLEAFSGKKDGVNEFSKMIALPESLKRLLGHDSAGSTRKFDQSSPSDIAAQSSLLEVENLSRVEVPATPSSSSQEKDRSIENSTDESSSQLIEEIGLESPLIKSQKRQIDDTTNRVKKRVTFGQTEMQYFHDQRITPSEQVATNIPEVMFNSNDSERIGGITDRCTVSRPQNILRFDTQQPFTTSTEVIMTPEQSPTRSQGTKSTEPMHNQAFPQESSKQGSHPGQRGFPASHNSSSDRLGPYPPSGLFREPNPVSPRVRTSQETRDNPEKSPIAQQGSQDGGESPPQRSPRQHSPQTNFSPRMKLPTFTPPNFQPRKHSPLTGRDTQVASSSPSAVNPVSKPNEIGAPVSIAPPLRRTDSSYFTGCNDSLPRSQEEDTNRSSQGKSPTSSNTGMEQRQVMKNFHPHQESNLMSFHFLSPDKNLPTSVSSTPGTGNTGMPQTDDFTFKTPTNQSGRAFIPSPIFGSPVSTPSSQPSVTDLMTPSVSESSGLLSPPMPNKNFQPFTSQESSTTFGNFLFGSPRETENEPSSMASSFFNLFG